MTSSSIKRLSTTQGLASLTSARRDKFHEGPQSKQFSCRSKLSCGGDEMSWSSKKKSSCRQLNSFHLEEWESSQSPEQSRVRAGLGKKKPPGHLWFILAPHSYKLFPYNTLLDTMHCLHWRWTKVLVPKKLRQTKKIWYRHKRIVGPPGNALYAPLPIQPRIQ